MKIRDADIKKVKNYLMSLPATEDGIKYTDSAIDGFIKTLIEDETGFEVAAKYANENHKDYQVCVIGTLRDVVNCE